MIFIDWLPTLRIACVEVTGGGGRGTAAHAPTAPAPDRPTGGQDAAASSLDEASGSAVPDDR